MKFARKPDFSQLPVVLVRWFRGRRRRIEIGADIIGATERGPFAAEPWSDAPAAFTGVRRRVVMRGGVPMFHIDLRHPDRGRSVRLASIRGLGESRAVWTGAARSLVLPTMDVTPVGLITRDAGEPDLPIRLLAARGRVPAADLDSALPPFPLVLHDRDNGAAEPDRLFLPGSAREVVAPVLDPAAAAALALFVVVAGALCWWDYPGEDILQPLLRVTRYLACIGFVLLAVALAVLAGERRRIVITPRGVTVGSSLYGRRRPGVTVPLDTLHSVLLPKPKIPFGVCTEITLAAPGVEVTIPALTRRQAVWLGRLIMAAAAGREIAVADTRPSGIARPEALSPETMPATLIEAGRLPEAGTASPSGAGPLAETGPAASTDAPTEASPSAESAPLEVPAANPSAGKS